MKHKVERVMPLMMFDQSHFPDAKKKWFVDDFKTQVGKQISHQVVVPVEKEMPESNELMLSCVIYTFSVEQMFDLRKRIKELEAKMDIKSVEYHMLQDILQATFK